MSDATTFPQVFGRDLGGQRFIEVYNTNKELVDFTVHKMNNPSGFFKVWRDYCTKKINDSSELNCSDSDLSDDER